MSIIFQTLRSSTATAKPLVSTRQPGELWVNFPDRQLGLIDAAQASQPLIAVRYFSTLTSYVSGDVVVQGGALWIAKASVPAGAFVATQWNQVATYTGGTFASLILNGAAGTARSLWAQTAGVNRWELRLADQIAEGGANVGSNFDLVSYDDAGALIGIPLAINRKTGVATFSAAPIIPGGYLPLSGGTLTGNLVVDGPNAAFVLDKDASGQSASIYGRTNGLSRWAIALGDGNAETGSQVGSSFAVYRFNDAGGLIEAPFTMLRTNGWATFNFVLETKSQLRVNATAAANTIPIYGLVNNAMRWGLYLGNGGTESGGNVGNDFQLTRCNDAGTAIDSPITISRAGASGSATISLTGSVTMTNNSVCNGIFQSLQYVSAPTIYGISGNVISRAVANGDALFQFQNSAGASMGQLYYGHTNNNLTLYNANGGGYFTLSGAGVLATSNIVNAFGLGGHQGMSGGFSGYQHNFDWTGAYIQGWVGSTFIGNIQMVSDYRIKKDVADLPSTWNNVKALRPISYTHQDYHPEWEDGENAPTALNDAGEEKGAFIKEDGVLHWGFLAHELQDALIEDAATGYKDAPNLLQAPNPWTVIATLTKALQEAMTRIEALEARLA